jgi:hypothetical protein
LQAGFQKNRIAAAATPASAIRASRFGVWSSGAASACPTTKIRESIQGLTQADLDAARTYCVSHAEEIDEAIRLNAEA